MKVVITGVSGYIGGLIAKKMVSLGHQVLGFDRNDLSDDLKNQIEFVKFDLSTQGWQEKIADCQALIHCAFEIKSRYGKINEQERNNIEMCDQVFQWSLSKNISKVIYLSSAAAYGAKEENIGRLLKETDLLSEKIYPYGSHKRIVEERFRELLEDYSDYSGNVYFLRLATVNGEKGSKRTKSLLSFIKDTPILPYAGSHSARQYVNEKDVVGAIEYLLSYRGQKFDVFNLAPSDFLTLPEMANIQGKIAMRIPIWMVKVGFFLNWHVLQGKIFATAPGSWRSFVFPSNIDGRKIKDIGFQYLYEKSEPSFLGK